MRRGSRIIMAVILFADVVLSAAAHIPMDYWGVAMAFVVAMVLIFGGSDE